MSLRFRTRRFDVVTATTTALALLAIGAAHGGPPPEPKPSVVVHQMQPLAEVARVTMPALELKEIRADDLERERLGLPPRYAIPHSVALTPSRDGTWEAVDGGLMVWRLRINAANATSINLGFTRYHMPPGGHLFVHAADLSFVIRPFTDADNETHGELWTPPVPSNEIVVEVTVPAVARRQLDLVLGSINLGYRGFGEMIDFSGSCNVDVICPEGDGWRDEIPSVAVISTGGSTFCTGFMVNNVRQDLTPYFMTANHCGISAGNAASLVAFWNYENSFCRPPGSPQSGQPGNGTLDQFNTGSFHRASYGGSDFTLVELDDDPDPAWFVSYAGWDATGDEGTSAVAIHHPNTDEKRISFEDQPTTTTSYLGESIPGDGTHVRVEDWDLGTTEPGSSGSPLFNQAHRVIGQLHGGYASCTSQTSDWYGKMSVSWANGLSQWLDPDGTGTLFVNTVSTRGLTITPLGHVTHLGEVGGPFTNDGFVYTLTNQTADPVDYEVSLTTFVGLFLDGGFGPLTGTLPPLGGTATVIVTCGPVLYGMPAGIYEEEIVFTDLSNGIARTQPHTIEIGQTGFTTSPELAFPSSGPVGGPFPETMVYTITSTHPTAVDVTITGSESWIALNGSAAPFVVTLTGIGDAADVEVGFSGAASALPAGIYTGQVLFSNQSGGVGDTSRDVMLDVGRLVYRADDVPLPIRDYETTTSIITVTDDFCIGDVDVEMDITHTYIGDLTIDLQSPDGTIVRLHDRNGGSTNNIVTMYDDDGQGTPPAGPGTLGDFDLSSVQGTWTLTVTDNAGADTGTLNAWALRIAQIAGNCPTVELVHRFPLDVDPGWTTEDQWAFGQPTGGGGQSGNPDPTSGYTGVNVYGFNLQGDYPNDMQETEYLTTGAIDCSQLSRARLKFQRWLGVESATWDHANIEISVDASTWTTVWEHTGGAISDSQWTLVSYDISAIADGEPTVYLRWGMGPTDGSVVYCGWNIDDVEIWGVLEGCPPDVNGDGVVDVLDLLAVLTAWGASGGPEDVNGDGIVDVLDLLEVLAAWGPC